MSLPTPAARAVSRARRGLARRAGRGGRRGVILLYHRVARAEPDPWRLAVSPERFADHMELLSRELRPLPLGELARAARRRGLPAGAVAVTFDDGYADNLEVGLPALDSAGVPATVFAATGYIQAGGPFWWDELASLMLRAERLPSELRLQVAGAHRRWATGTADERGTALAELQLALRHSTPEGVGRAMARLRAWAGHGGGSGPGGRPMTIDELRRLAAGGLVEVGAHGRAHVSLAGMDPAAALREVERSRDDLADWLGGPPAVFSYPFGDHGPRARRAVRRAGFELGTGTAPAPVTWLTDPFELPRLWVEDEDAGRLEARVRRLLG